MRSRHPALRWIAFVALVGVPGVATIAAAGGDDAPREDALVELGRRLFFDPAASRSGMRACSDCHDPRHGYSDRAKVSRDDRGPTVRHSQTLVDGARNPSAHWDGAFRRVEDLVLARLTLSPARKGSAGHGLGLGNSPTPSGQRRATGSSGGGGYGDGGGAVPPRENPDTGVGTETPPGEVPGDVPGDDPYGGTDDSGTSDDAEDSGGGGPSYSGPDTRAPSSAEPSAPSAPPPTTESTPTAPPPPTGPTPPAPPPPGAPAPDGAAPADSPARPDPYAKEAFGTEPDEHTEFLAPSVDVDRLPQAHHVLAEAGRYREAFQAAFGTGTPSARRIADAIQAYCRSIESGGSAYDRFAAGDSTALSPAARRGLALFEGKAGCASCHTIRGARADFSDYAFHDTGVAWKSLPAKSDAERAKIADEVADAGAFATTTRPGTRRAFKTPTLRDVARRGPYFHDGSAATLEDAVRHYLSGKIGDPALDDRMPELVAGDEDVRDLVAFLRALTSRTRPGAATTAWSERPARTRLRFVDADGKPIAGWVVTIVPAGDALPVPGSRAAVRLVTDGDGVVELAPFATTHAKILLEGGLRPEGGALVPDTCRQAVLRIPVRGSARLAVTFPKDEAVPEAFVAEHPRAQFFPDRRIPRTILRQVSRISLPDGRSVALYVARFRTDVPATASVKLPRPRWGLDRLQVAFDPEERASIDLSR